MEGEVGKKGEGKGGEEGGKIGWHAKEMKKSYLNKKDRKNRMLEGSFRTTQQIQQFG